MLIYLIIIFFILIFMKKINKGNKIIEFLTLSLLILVCGLRYNVGTDYNLYVEMFHNIDVIGRTELVVRTIIKINQFIFRYREQFFFLSMSILTIMFYYLGIKNISKKKGNSLFLFVALGYYAVMFNGIRQALAMAICFFATRYINERKFLKYVIIILLATFCHTTALIMIPMYFLNKIRVNKKTSLILTVIFSSSYILYDIVLKVVTTYIPRYAPYATKTYMTYSEAGTGTYVIAIFHIIIALLLILNKEKMIEENKENNTYFNLYLLSIIFYTMGFANTVVVRLAYYFSIYLIILLIDLFKIMFKEKNDKVYICINLFFILYYMIHLISFNQMIPYQINI